MANQMGYFSAGFFLAENIMKFCICQSINFPLHTLQNESAIFHPSQMKMKNCHKITFVQLGFCFYVSTFLMSVSYKLDTAMNICSFTPLHNFKFK